MLVEFTVGNFWSFKERRTISMEASPITDYKENVIITDGRRLLKSAVIYGANASGKSNLIKAMAAMRKIVLKSSQLSSAEIISEIIPFLLNSESEKKPTHFEVLFLIGNRRYRYGFEADRNKVFGEWLYQQQGKGKEKPLFIREGDGIEIRKEFEEGSGLESRTRDNALFLSVTDQFNGPISKGIMSWFNKWIILSGISHNNLMRKTFDMMRDNYSRKSLIDFYKKLDLGFEDVVLDISFFDKSKLPNLSSFPEIQKGIVKDFEGKPTYNVKTVHQKYDSIGSNVETVTFDLNFQESSGTKKVFDISGPIFEALDNNGVIVIDELDSKLHPLLTLAIVKLFNANNIRNSQLIFSTHDTNLLQCGQFRRDQIYFIEKNEQGESDVYSLVEYSENGEKVRKDRSFEKDYIQGRYGAIPFIGDLRTVIEYGSENKD